jgi:hypothetical protein
MMCLLPTTAGGMPMFRTNKPTSVCAHLEFAPEIHMSVKSEKANGQTK